MKTETKPKPKFPKIPAAPDSRAPALAVEAWPVDRPKPYAKNPRRNDAAVEKVAASIREFGWAQPIVVDGDGVIIIGHTRLKAAKKLGLKTVPVLVRADLSPEQVAALRLADNKTAELAEWDTPALDAELAELAEAGVDMEQFGFFKDEGAFDGCEAAKAIAPARITSPLDEQHEYVVLVCDNTVDWEQAKTVFGLGMREGFRTNRNNKNQAPIRCFSRVVPWADFARRFLDDENN